MAKSGGGQGASILFGGPPAGREAHFVPFHLSHTFLSLSFFFFFIIFFFLRFSFFSSSSFFFFFFNTTSNKRGMYTMDTVAGGPGKRTDVSMTAAHFSLFSLDFSLSLSLFRNVG